MNRDLKLVSLLAAVAMLGAGTGDASLDPPLPPPTRPRPILGRGYPARREPPPPREPTRDELRAEEKRKRKAAKRLAERGRTAR